MAETHELARSNLTKLGRRRGLKARDVVRVMRGRYAGRTAEVVDVGPKRVTVQLRRRLSKKRQDAVSAKIGELVREGMPQQNAIRAAYEELDKGTLRANPSKGDGPMIYFTNPPEDRMARHLSAATRAKLSRLARARPRGPGGRFLSEGGRSSRSHHNPPRGSHLSASTKAKLRAAAARRPRNRFGEFLPEGRGRSHHNPRHNPPGVIGFVEVLKDGTIGVVTLTASKMVTRAVPDLAKKPRTSAVGMASMLAVGVVASYAAYRLSGEELAKWVLAGSLQAPLEDMAVEKTAASTSGIGSWIRDELVPGAGNAPGTVAMYPTEADIMAARAQLAPGTSGDYSDSGFGY